MRALFLGITVAATVTWCSSAGAQTRRVRTAAPIAAQPVAQGNGDFVVMPQGRPASRRSGLQLSVDTHWANGYGYRPVEVTISSPKPTTADHLITVRLHSGYENDIGVEKDFEIPLGSTKVATTVTVPMYEQVMYTFWWDVWVDGVKDLDLSIEKTDALRRSGWSGVSNSGVRILVSGPEAGHKSLVTTSSNDFEVLTLKLGDFPRRWIDYTCFDVISLSTSDLQSLAQTQPAAFEAIGRWVRTGGQLWLSDVGGKLEQLPHVSKLLRMSEVVAASGADAAAKEPVDKSNGQADAAEKDRASKVGWKPARFRDGMPQGPTQVFTDIRTGKSRRVRDPRVIAALQQDPNFIKTNQQVNVPNEDLERGSESDSAQWFVEQSLGLGLVRAFRGANDAALFAHSTPANPNTAANVSVSGQIPRPLAMAVQTAESWERRHGMIPDSGNVEFAKLLVPGVGRAPVTEFQVLITLFVLLIGPLNYWVLKRFKRLQLLVLTVPLAAGVATAALFAYAIVSDGFATTVRARSFTMLDQRTGEAACWAQLSYYAGLAPGKGLIMPDDVALYPILPSWTSESNSGPDRAMLWDENQAKLTRGWLTSRTPTQYLTLRARNTPYRLDVLVGGGKMRITNRLGTQIHSLLVIDEAGKFFGGEQLANDSKVVLEAISRDEAVKRIVELVRDNEPEMPAALAGSDRDFSSNRGRSSRRMFGRYRPPSSGEQLGENLASLAVSDLAGLNGRPALDLPPRSYIAVTATGPEVETGIPNAEEEASFHVIVGRW